MLHDSLRVHPGFVATFFSTILVLWLTGATDFLFEKSVRHFRWAPYVNVRHQVVRELLGEPSEFLYYNDWEDFERVLEPSCKNNRLIRRRSLLIIVKTAPDRLANRDAIRGTWGSENLSSGFRIRTVFVMGNLDQASFDLYGDVLVAEQRQHGDLLVGGFLDSYFNNTLKFVHAIKFARHMCGSEQPVPYVLLVDDDYYVNVKNLVAEAEKHPPNERLYMGWRFDTSPFRLFYSKFKARRGRRIQANLLTYSRCR
ncbi:Galactosyltransferase family protein [Aphelenchoides avenae]|nr:Galactosyltransferase family protein [Aphelenchus avenae]